MHEAPHCRRAAAPAAMTGAGVPPAAAGLPAIATGVLAFDFGTRHIGVAVGDAQTRLAHPLEHIDAEDNAARFGRIAELIREWQPGLLVVGLPLDEEGAEHDLTRRARRFGRQLQGRFGLPVDFVDERFTSVEAESSLRSRGRGGRSHKDETHALAAQLILQAWLDGRPH